MKRISGFTWIELCIVIVLLIILGAIAIPKFIDLTTDAKTHKLATSLTSANEENYAARKKNSTKGIAVTNCSDIAKALQGGTLPMNYSIVAAPVAVNVPASCILKGPKDTQAQFTATGIK